MFPAQLTFRGATHVDISDVSWFVVPSLQLVFVWRQWTRVGCVVFCPPVLHFLNLLQSQISCEQFSRRPTADTTMRERRPTLNPSKLTERIRNEGCCVTLKRRARSLWIFSTRRDATIIEVEPHLLSWGSHCKQGLCTLCRPKPSPRKRSCRWQQGRGGAASLPSDTSHVHSKTQMPKVGLFQRRCGSPRQAPTHRHCACAHCNTLQQLCPLDESRGFLHRVHSVTYALSESGTQRALKV
jgi:hypothetical protein